MGVNTVKQTLTGALAAGETLVLDERLDVYRHAETAEHVLVLKNNTARYIAPTDFTVAIDGRGKATVTWLHADTLASGSELSFGFWQFDNTSNGTQTGGSSGGSPVSNPTNPLDPVSGVSGGSYIFAATGSAWTTQTLKLQYLLPDGTTWADAIGTSGDAELAAPGAVGVVIGEGASLRVVASAPITDLVWSLS